MTKVLIISFSKIKNDPRVMRQIKLLQECYDITVAGFGSMPDCSIRYVELTPFKVSYAIKAWWALKLLFKFYENYYWNRFDVRDALDKLSGNYYDVLIANDISALPLSLKLSCGRPVLIDAHEYSPREFDDKFVWRILFGRYQHYMCNTYLRLASDMTTVCSGIAEEYFKNYGVVAKVVYNAPANQHLKANPVDGNHIRLIHHGSSIRSRHLETMIDLMHYLDDRFTLDLMLVDTDRKYIKTLKEKAKFEKRIKFIPPVKLENICEKLNTYDIGIYLLPPVNFNHEYALPNKFFEFIQARLAVAIGPSPEMCKIIKEFNCGIVAKTFNPKDLGTLISSISETELNNYKLSAEIAATDLNYDTSGKIMLSAIQSLVHRD